jgi:hypothetical protein
MAGLADGDAAGGPDDTGGGRETEDIAFRIARPQPSLITRVGIDTVLYPLYGRVAEPGQRHPQAHRLIGLWRDRVAELVRRGWDPAPGADPDAAARRVRQLRNCSPPFVAAHPPSSCGLSSLCPFCWGREAMRIWGLADRVFFPPDPPSGRRPERPAFGLVETARTHRLPGTDPRLLAAFLADRVRRPPRGTPVGPCYRPHEIQQYPIRGGYETIAISAAARGRDPGSWEVTIRQLLAVAPEHVGLLQPPPYRRIRIRVSRHSQPDRMGLARATARLCRYPPWLLRGDPGQVLDALAARAGLRLGAAFGNFRGARPVPGPPRTDELERAR